MKQPLYKVLNEQRTQGEVTIDTSPEPDITLWIKKPNPNPGNISECIATIWANDKTEANAQYTALSVNNLASLAEALEDVMEDLKNMACNYGGYSFNENYKNYFGKLASYAEAKEALTRIS